MRKQRLPHGWSQKRIRELADQHDRQTEGEQAAEIEAATGLEQTLSARQQHVRSGNFKAYDADETLKRIERILTEGDRR